MYVLLRDHLLRTRLTFVSYQTPNIYLANEMALAHNMYIRGLNAAVLQAKGVTTKRNICDFLTFSACWVETIHHHHPLEEEMLFPKIETELSLDA